MRAHPSPADAERAADATVLDLLIGDPFPWSRDELARNLDEPTAADDAIMRLRAAGLVHRLGEFVFPTRAARCADELRR